MLLYIKNMVCHRCKMVVKSELEKAGLHPVTVSLGEAAIEESQLSASQAAQLATGLQRVGFELIDDRRSRHIDQIKTFIIDAIHYQQHAPVKKFSELLAKHLHHDYSYLSNLFSQVEGITIEQYIIQQRIEKVKELLLYDELSLSEIAFRLGFSSNAHLSAQFKKVTGLTPLTFRKSGTGNRRSLDDIGNKK